MVAFGYACLRRSQFGGRKGAIAFGEMRGGDRNLGRAEQTKNSSTIDKNLKHTLYIFGKYTYMSTFEQVLDLVDALPLDQQELLIDIVQRRAIEARRQELARTSQEALEEFRSGTLPTQTATEAIAELRRYLDAPEE